MPKTFLTNYFGFNKQQRNGIYVLISLSMLLLLIRLSLTYFIEPDEIQVLNLPLIARNLDSLAATSKPHFQKNMSFKEFNPNTITFNGLLQMGLKEKTANNFIKFREKGFVFREKHDLLKVYGIDSALYTQLEPYISIPIQNNNQKKIQIITSEKKDFKNKEAQSFKKLDLNRVDSAELVAIKGIGPSYAKRILKYRSLLGGYFSIEQLKEVYGMRDETYNLIKDNFTIDINAIEKLKINSDDFKKINKHPYITYELCKDLFEWRRKTKITSINLKSIVNDSGLYTKLLPYLLFE